MVHSPHDLWVLTCTQRKKLSAQVTPDNGNTADATAASTDVTLDWSSNHDPVNAPSSARLVETVEDDDSSVDSPSMPNLRFHHPSSDSDSDNSETASQTSVHISPSESQAFAPSLQ